MINAIAIDDEPLALTVVESFCKKSDIVTLKKVFTNPVEALQYLKEFPVDLLFLDIHMPAMNGFKILKTMQQKTMVIFTTANSEYALESYDFNAIDYLLKPFTPLRFQQAVKKAEDYFNYINKLPNPADKNIFIRSEFNLVKVPLEDILYIESIGDYLKFFIKDRKTVVTRMPMKVILDKISSTEFIRVHRSFIVPIKRMQSMRGKNIVIPEREIPVGNTYLNSLTIFFKSGK